MKQTLLFVISIFLAYSAYAVPTEIESPVYIVVGDAVLCNGVNWANSDLNALSGDPLSITYQDVPAGTYDCQLTLDDQSVFYGCGDVDVACSTTDFIGACASAGNAIKLELSRSGDISLSFDPLDEKICIVVTLDDIEVTSYTLVGDPLIFGSDYDVADVDNDMLHGSLGDESWTKMYENVLLSAGSYPYKVVGNHDDEVYQFPFSGANQELVIETSGLYFIGFSFSEGNSGEPELIANPMLITSVEDAQALVISAVSGTIFLDEAFQIFTMKGVDVTDQNGQLKGNYIVKTNSGFTSVIHVQ